MFDATHRLLLDLNHRGLVEGFRIDHPDGLADPEPATCAGCARRRVPGTGIWVEKILEGSEQLPYDWPCDGTTGYDAAARGRAARWSTPPAPPRSPRPGSRPAAIRTCTGWCRSPSAWSPSSCWRPSAPGSPAGRREALPEADPARLAAAVAELLVAAEVYRAYVRPGTRPPARPAGCSRRPRPGPSPRRPDLEVELNRLRDLALDPKDEAAADFAVRLQQTWGPVMAKGIEDTAFYRYHRMVALNEVGGDPLLLDEGGPGPAARVGRAAAGALAARA